jgi:hypothetical protein
MSRVTIPVRYVSGMDPRRDTVGSGSQIEIDAEMTELQMFAALQSFLTVVSDAVWAEWLARVEEEAV